MRSDLESYASTLNDNSNHAHLARKSRQTATQPLKQTNIINYRRIACRSWSPDGNAYSGTIMLENSIRHRIHGHHGCSSRTHGHYGHIKQRVSPLKTDWLPQHSSRLLSTKTCNKSWIIWKLWHTLRQCVLPEMTIKPSIHNVGQG